MKKVNDVNEAKSFLTSFINRFKASRPCVSYSRRSGGCAIIPSIIELNEVEYEKAKSEVEQIGKTNHEAIHTDETYVVASIEEWNRDYVEIATHRDDDGFLVVENKEHRIQCASHFVAYFGYIGRNKYDHLFYNEMLYHVVFIKKGEK